MGELDLEVEDGVLVLVLDLADELAGDRGEYRHQFSGRSFRCESVPVGLFTAFVRGGATRWTRRPVYVKPGEITDLGAIQLEPLPTVAVSRPTALDASPPDPRLRTPPSDPTLGVLVGELSAEEHEGMLVLTLDLADTLERDCGEYTHRFSGRWFRCESVPLGLYTAFVRGSATRWARRAVHVEPGVVTDLGSIELVPLPGHAVIRGIVRDHLGQPLEGVQVSYAISSCGSFIPWSLDWTTTTTNAGAFVLHPEQREVMVGAFKEGYGPKDPAWITGDMAEWGDLLELVMTPWD